MTKAKQCSRILLAGVDGCRVLYCETCGVTELEIGAMSLRLELGAFNSLGELIKEAKVQLAAFKVEQANHQFAAGVKNVH